MFAKFTRIGVSSIIGAIIAIAIVLSIFTTIIIYGFSALNTQQQSLEYSRSLEMNRQMENLNVTYSTEDGTTKITIENTGGIRVDLKYLIYKDDTGQTHILDLWLVGLNLPETTSSGIYLKESVDAGTYNVTQNNGYLYLLPEGRITIEITGTAHPLEIITSTGNVIKIISLTGQAGYSQVAGSVIVYPINLGTFEDLINSDDIQIDEDKLNSGMRSYKAYYDIDYTGTNVDIETSAQFRFGNVIIGFNTEEPGNTQSYNILITGPYEPENDEYYIKIGGSNTIQPDDKYPYGWRIKIIGFTPDQPSDIHIVYEPKQGRSIDATGPDALGIYYYANKRSLVVENAYLYLKGKAEKIIIYKRVPVETVNEIQPSSYDPYIFTADVDGNGISEMYFITEDTHYGDISRYLLTNVFGNTIENDWYSLNDALPDDYCIYVPFLGCTKHFTLPPDRCICDGSSIDLGILKLKCNFERAFVYDDWSIEPFFFKLTGYPVNGGNVAMISVTFRLYFHDNIDDILEKRVIESANIPILGVYLIDEDGNIVNSREFNYQDLAGRENTFPANSNFFTETVSLFVPSEPKKYYVAIMFRDPYGNYDVNNGIGLPSHRGYDDADFTIGIEWVGMSFYARPG